jgi:uncharacterized protein YjiS (DUF1127 family)
MREPDLTGVDYRTPEQWEQLRRGILLRAEIARAQALRHLFRSLLALLRIAWRTGQTTVRVLVERVTAVLGKWWRAFAQWRARKAAVRELHALDDRALRDIGINRSEIESVVSGRDETRLRDATIAAAQCRRSDARPSPSAKVRLKQSTAHLARKSAA